MPFVSVRITRDGVTREQKAQVIAEITETLQRVLGKPPELTHIVIEEIDTDNWGYKGITTTEFRKTSRVDSAAKQNSRPRGGFFVGAGKGLLTIRWRYPTHWSAAER